MTFDSNKATSKKIRIIIYGTIITGALIFFSQFLLLTKSKAEKETEQMVLMMNEKCPQSLDDETRVESIYVVSKNKIGLNILLPRISGSIFLTKFFKESVLSDIKRQMKTSDFLKPLYQKNITIVCSYYDKNVQKLFEIILQPGDIGTRASAVINRLYLTLVKMYPIKQLWKSNSTPNRI